MNFNQATIFVLAAIFLCTAYAGYSHSYAHHVQDHHDLGGHHDGGHHHEEYHHGPIDYKYGYAVKDPHTGDDKEAWEHRHGDDVKGSYSLVEPDGSKRIVDYTADKHHGFSATVKTIGHHGHHVEHYPSHGHGY